MAVSQKRLAQLAGVSQATVSRVLSGEPFVAPEARRRVLDACQQQGYYPHAGARAMRQGRFSRVAASIVQYGPRGTIFTPNNGYLDPAADELAENDYSLVLEPLHMTYDGDRFVEPPRLFSEMGVDGVLGLPTGGIVPPEVDAQLARLGAPVVWMNRNPDEAETCVCCDEHAHGRELARHLIDLGHRRIGYVGFDSPHYAAKDRVAGFVEELESAGLDTSLSVFGPRPPCVLDLAERILSLSDPVTAVVAYNRGLFDAVLHVASRAGLRVPRDLSLCYFASAWELMSSNYDVTALALPEPEVAITAVRSLVAAIKGRKPPTAAPAAVRGSVHCGWTTALPGEEWNPSARRCRHDQGVCVKRPPAPSE